MAIGDLFPVSKIIIQCSNSMDGIQVSADWRDWSSCHENGVEIWTSCGAKAQQTSPRVAHHAVRIDPKCSQVVTPHLPWKFHANRSSHFLVILLTHKEINKEIDRKQYPHSKVAKSKAVDRSSRLPGRGSNPTAELTDVFPRFLSSPSVSMTTGTK